MKACVKPAHMGPRRSDYDNPRRGGSPFHEVEALSVTVPSLDATIRSCKSLKGIDARPFYSSPSVPAAACHNMHPSGLLNAPQVSCGLGHHYSRALGRSWLLPLPNSL